MLLKWRSVSGWVEVTVEWYNAGKLFMLLPEFDCREGEVLSGKKIPGRHGH